jgi:molybdenum cofactor cytidylyltransferase
MEKGVLILAAGAATRMKRAKMLLPFASTTILSHILQEVQTIRPDSICLVTGCYHNEIQNSITTAQLDIVYNGNWEDGMAGSIKLGLATLLQKHPDLRSVLIVASDQPYLNRKVLADMIDALDDNQKGIVAAKYQEMIGIPVLFDQKYFEHLRQLQGDRGARTILQQYQEDIVTIDFPLGAIDIDTPEDYEKFCLQTKEQQA